jgi:hypothetical protein
VWRSVDCVPVYMVYQGLSCVEACKLCTCLDGYQELSYVVKEPVCIVCQEPNCVESIDCAPECNLYATKNSGMWGSVDCMVGPGLSYEE